MLANDCINVKKEAKNDENRPFLAIYARYGPRYSINIGYECIFYHPNIVTRPFNHINLQHDYACAEKSP